MTMPSPFEEAARFHQGRSGASRDIAVMVLRRLDPRLRIRIRIKIKIKIRIKPKASATKAAGYFLLS
jgi:hypothetical protein